MAKVWLVIEPGDYDDPDTVIGVYSSQDFADRAARITGGLVGPSFDLDVVRPNPIYLKVEPAMPLRSMYEPGPELIPFMVQIGRAQVHTMVPRPIPSMAGAGLAACRG